MAYSVLAEGVFGDFHPEVSVLSLTMRPARQLHGLSSDLGSAGGPQAGGARAGAETAAMILREQLAADQKELLDRFARNEVTVLIVNGMIEVSDDVIPPALPSKEVLKDDLRCLTIASRSQILLALAANRTFAYDLDYNEVVRLVANFKGGGKNKLENEPPPDQVELSSHSGLALGAHTEPPYYCSFKPSDGHSPPPSTLILSARWNPSREPTIVIPLTAVLKAIGPNACEELTRKTFNFSRPDSYVAGEEDGRAVSILDYDETGDFAVRFNAYRFTTPADATPQAREALALLKREVGRAAQVKVPLDSTVAILINNTKALHCRDIIQDNRRLLVRLFGYSRSTSAIELSSDPLLVKG
ncbi:hypothetical protein ACVIJ6_006810 [Bradyrhizobium sp. USDA 4369]